ncbi:hypothetical protein [Ferrimicrobium sp.]|uniref:YgfZ/GcvT domain-containing protein n=1 Tax=Ferrimicrobium sp. TaxID=2926050 RepID=UPI0026277D2C|nr:hypothetical protein [Ferrimicrobium sp.]
MSTPFTEQQESPRAAATRPERVTCLPLASLQVNGPDASRFLQGQLTNDLNHLDEKTPLIAAVCTPDGKLVTIASLQRINEDTLRLITYREHLNLLHERLARFRIRVKADITVEDLHWATSLTSQATALWPLDTALVPLPAGDDGASDEAFAHLRLARLATHLPSDAPPDLLVAGVPTLVATGVSFTKGCYVGQELVARTDSRHARPPASLFVQRYSPLSLEALLHLPTPPLPLTAASGDLAGEVRALLLEDTTVVVSGWVKRRFGDQSGLMIDARPSTAIPVALAP